MTVFLARHTESEYNTKGLINSDPSVPVNLTQKGIKQAKQLAQQLANKPIQVIFTSEFIRAQQTATIINQTLKKRILIEPLINENTTGFEGKPLTTWLQALEQSDNPWNAQFNGGESQADAFARTKQFIEKLQKSTYHSVLVVTHGFHVEAFRGLVNDKDGSEAMGNLVPQGQYIQLTFSK